MFVSMSSFVSSINLAKAQSMNSFKMMNSKVNVALANKLEQLGIISGFKVEQDQLSVYMKYVNKRVPFVSMYMVGKSSSNSYMDLQRLSHLIDSNGSSIFILSTGRGFLSHAECFASSCSGEIIISIDL